MPHAQFILFASASGYGLFEVTEAEEIGALLPTVQASMTDASKFGKLLKMKAFQPFATAANALENANHISESLLSDDLKAFLEQNLPRVKPGKKAKFLVGVVDPKIGNAIQDELSVPCNSNETVLELIRGVRLHLPKFIKALASGNMEKAQLGLAHSYSRAKVKFNVNKSDNMIIQAICLLDQLDKDLNTFAMRVREWYSWHFPELEKLVKDNFVYARVAKYIGDRTTFTDDKLPGLVALVGDDEDIAKAVLEASRASMGMDISPIDLLNIDTFATRLVSLANYRQTLYKYLEDKMAVVAPNLAALIGEVVAARLISHAGSLTNLAKCPASTVQILGAEKALFRALKTRGNTPKYGLIFHSSFIGRAAAKNKGRISRYLANKCSMAARIDSFADYTTTKYGERLRDQVEERLKFYDSGVAPRKNVDVMQEVADLLRADGVDVDGTKAAAAKAAARAGAGAGAGAAASPPAGKDKKKKKKKKKDKKRAREEAAATATADDSDSDVDMAAPSPKKQRTAETPKSAKKQKKDKKKKDKKKKKKKSSE